MIFEPRRTQRARRKKEEEVTVLNDLINENPIYMGAHFPTHNISVIETEIFVKG